jgi:uncharacterized protein (TIGR02996 family)
MIQAFEDALKADPTDRASRMAYADWLDEHGSPDLADYHRRWPLSEIELLKDELRAERLRADYGGCAC